MSEFRRTLGFGIVLSAVLAVSVVFVDRTADVVIFSVEKVTQPCAHGGVYREDGTCDCPAVWTGTYCTECACENGVCDTVGVQVEFPGTMWGCRCSDLKTIGPLCDVCNANRTEDGRCAGACQPPFTGLKCDVLCNKEATYSEVIAGGLYERELALLEYGGRLDVCSGHGECVNGACQCEELYFSSEDGRSSCARTCPVDKDGLQCYGNGVCQESASSGLVFCSCAHGYDLVSDCSVACPGVNDVNGEPCSGRGTCRLGKIDDGESTEEAFCDCAPMYQGESCRYRCPSGDSAGSIPCSGHGECAMGKKSVFGVGNVTAAVCSCNLGYSGPSCDCSAQGKCSGHGQCGDDGTCQCLPLWSGDENCRRCVPGHFGSDCTLQCLPRDTGRPIVKGKDIHCSGFANCAVADFGLASEEVVCAECVNNLDSEAFCRECKEEWWPKASAVDTLEEACTIHGGPHTCNHNGMPVDSYGKPGSAEAPCRCDQEFADPFSYCTQCLPTYYPASFGDDPANACTKRCVDDPNVEAPDNVLRCLNGGRCTALAECSCIDGYTGQTCAVGCGALESDGSVCSGNGKCVTTLLQSFLEHRLDVVNASRCECASEFLDISEEERLSAFLGEFDLSRGTLEEHSPWFGKTCSHVCLSAPWLHGDVCNGEGDCVVEPFVNDIGSAILNCQYDNDCGKYSAENGLEFFDAFGEKRTDLSLNEMLLGNQMSAMMRFSPLQGPFCHNPNDVPGGIWEPNLQCRQRTTEDAQDDAVESTCEQQTTRKQCLSQEGNCKYADVCAEALRDFDTWSYCYLLMSTREPAALSSKVCADTCVSEAVDAITWTTNCDHFRARMPAEFSSCSTVGQLDGLCDVEGVGDVLTSCLESLPPRGGAGGITLRASDTSAYCWELSGVAYPFAFAPLLQEREARRLQANFDTAFLSLGEKETCLSSAQFDVGSSCAGLRSPSADLAAVLHKCRVDGKDVLSRADLSGTGVDCVELRTVLDLDPFSLRCSDGTGVVVDLADLTLLEAVEESLRPAYKNKCSLQPKTPVHAEGVAVSFANAGEVCEMVLEKESPSPCNLACGDDACTDLGVADNKRVLQCRRPAGVFDVAVDDQGKCDKCAVGECSVVQGLSEYRCVVREEDLSQSCAFTYAPCNTLLLHADRLGYDEDETTLGVAGSLVLEPVQGLGGQRVAVDGGAAPERVEFDVLITSASRGTVSVDGVNGSLTSVLFHHFGGSGWDVRGEENAPQVCAVGDECKALFPVNEFVHQVVVDLDWGANKSTVTVDGVSKTQDLFDAGAFTGISVLGSARVQNLWVFSAPDMSQTSCGSEEAVEMCSKLHRGVGRAVTWRESLRPAEELPLSSVQFCAGLENAFSGPVSSCRHQRKAIFRVPWDNYCAYADYLSGISDTGDCEGKGLDRESTVACEPSLSKFSTVDCAYGAADFDWEGWCDGVQKDVVPQALLNAGCSQECLDRVRATDMVDMCDRHEEWWDSADRPSPQVPKDCAGGAAMEERWSSANWTAFCTAKAENKAVGGVCSFANCDCSSGGGWMAGGSCELDCPFNNADLSPCAEDSFAGVCDYRQKDAAKADAYYASPSDETRLYNREMTSIPGRCLCAHQDAYAKDGCRVECSKDGAPACNNRTYVVEASDGTKEEYEISSCDAGGTGACRCLAPYTRKVTQTLRHKGRVQEILVPDYGSPPNASDAFRVHSAQGAISFVQNYLKKPKDLWRDYRQRFESNPGEFQCEGKPCTSHDVVLAQSLWGGNGNLHFGSTCSQPCPGVDMGEEMVAHAGCGPGSGVVSTDTLTMQEACLSECLDNFKCRFASFFDNQCKMYSDCDADLPDATAAWFERKVVREPVLKACGGRGVCTTTGQCSCDMAKMLVLTSPITGEKTVVGANEKGDTLATVPLTTLEKTPFRGKQCQFTCPGWNSDGSESMETVCSGHGICTRDSAQCVCDAGWTGVACELPCPVSDKGNSESICSGHGICSEMRLGPEDDKEEESTKRVYMISEAFRKWHNECEDNKKLDYFILPFGDFNGTVPVEELRGGKDCSLVPQQGDDPTKPWVVRPELTGLDYLTDFQMFDSEQDLAAENYGDVDGASDAHARTGMFRWRRWEGEENQTVFVEDYAVVETITNTSTRFEKFPGFRCGGTFIKQDALLSSVGECAEQCEAVEGCVCFHWKPHLHSSYVGKCVLAREGPLINYDVKLAVAVHGHGGLLREDANDGVAMPFEQFSGAYVEFFKDRACRAPTQVLGSGVTNVPDCAALCAARNSADANSCLFFSYNQQTLTCRLVRTATAECPEGFSTNNPSGFYAIVSSDEGTSAPTAYTSTGSARVFPVSKPTRGRRWGSYTGRARPGYTVGLASCTCTANLAFGYFDGIDCAVCAKHFSTKTCSKKCVGILPDDSTCFGFGQCIWGMEHEGNCMCGSPPAPVGTGLNVGGGAFDIQESDLEVTVKFTPLSTTAEFYEDPRNYRFANKYCSGCQNNYGGLNCAFQASYCLYGSSPVFTASQSVGVPCQCLDTNKFSPFHSCCPLGFILSDMQVHSDVGSLTTSQRRKRLNAQPGDTTPPGTFYDSAISPSTATAPNPSKRWCMPCPNVYETEWLRTNDPNAKASVCKGTGSCSDLGKREMVVTGVPARYTPQTCAEIGWEQTTRDLYYVYDDAVFLNASNQDPSSRIFSESLQDISNPPVKQSGQTMDNFIAGCQVLCSDATSCTGFVLKQTFGTTDARCFLTTRAYVGSLTETLAKETLSKFSSFRLERQYGFCIKAGNYCALGTTTWGEIDFCADVTLDTHADDNEGNTQPVSVNNLGERQEAGAPNLETRAPNLYAPKADGFAFGAFGKNPFEVTATESLKLGQMRPENPCSTLGDEWYWDPDDRSRCKSSNGQICQVNDWITCEGKQMSGGTLHPIHDKIAKWPHRIYVGEIEKETAVFDLTRELAPRPQDLTALETQRDNANARANTLKAEYEQLQADIDFSLPTILDGSYSVTSGLVVNYHVGWEPFYYLQADSSYVSLQNTHNVFYQMLWDTPYVWEGTESVPSKYCKYSSWQYHCKKVYNPVDLITGNVWRYTSWPPGAKLEECGPHSDTWNKVPYNSNTNLYGTQYLSAETQCLGIKQAFEIMKKFKEKIEEDIAAVDSTYAETYANCLSDCVLWLCRKNCESLQDPDTLRSKLTEFLVGVEYNYGIAAFRYSQALISITVKKNQEASAKMEATAAQAAIDSAKLGQTCTPELPCDVCQSNCEHDNECRAGLICLSSTPVTQKWLNMLSAKICYTPSSDFDTSVSYCIPDTIVQPKHAQFYLAGYVKDEATYVTTILEVHKETRKILQEFAASEHAWDRHMKVPTHSGSLNVVRASQDLDANFDNLYYTLFNGNPIFQVLSLTKLDRAVPFRGEVYSGGIAGGVVPASYTLSPNNQKRGILVENAFIRDQNGLVGGLDVCAELCEKTPGCTFAEEHLGGLQGTSYYTVRKEFRRVCMLYNNSVPEDFSCDDEGSLLVHPCKCDTEPATTLGYSEDDNFYTEIDSGTCETHGFETLTSEADCGKAAIYFGIGSEAWKATQTVEQKYWEDYPYGCVTIRIPGVDGANMGVVTNLPGAEYDVTLALSRSRQREYGDMSAKTVPCGSALGSGLVGRKMCLCRATSAEKGKLKDFKVTARRPGGCGICRSRGMAQSNFAVSTSKNVLPQCGDAGENVNCSPFPKVSDDGYTWESLRRCPPARATTGAYTALTRVGQNFLASDSDPYTVSKEITFFSECEALCISYERCRAWHFYEQITGEAPSGYCELFDYVPGTVTTISGEENVFSATERIGTVERDYGGKIMVVDEKKTNAACLCDDDSPGGGYDCGCVASLATPFLPETTTNTLYGCNGKGVCLGDTYGCACEDGYEWSYGNTPAGWTCRACTAGKYKDNTLSRCEDCPYGKFTLPETSGATACVACPIGKTTFSPGTFAAVKSWCTFLNPEDCYMDALVYACDDCPAGRIAGDRAGTCQACPAGKYEAQIGIDYTERECKDCAVGFTTSSRGASSCDVKLEGCNTPGKGWQIMTSLAGVALGNARCTVCVAGKYSLIGNTCVDCPAGRQSALVGHKDECFECSIGKYNDEKGASACKNCAAGKYGITAGAQEAAACENCELGRYSGDLGHSDECFECPIGRYNDEEGASACKNCTAGKYGITAGAQEAAACENCELGRYLDGSGRYDLWHDLSLAEYVSLTNYEYVTEQTFYEGSRVRNFGVQGADCAAAGLVVIQTLDECMAAAQTKNSAVVISSEPVSETDQFPLSGCYLLGDPEGTPTAMFNPGQEDRHCGYRLTDNFYGICLCASARERQSPCLECSKGRFQSQEGAEDCKYCTTGKYQDTTGASACANCEVGQSSGDLLDGSRVGYEFEFVESGADCAAAGLMAVQTLDECMDAARTKNSAFVTSAQPIPEDARPSTPSGCYLLGDVEGTGAVYFNPEQTDVACGTTINFFGEVSQICLCARGETTVFTCPTCAVGMYQDEEGTSTCKNCAAGTYQDTIRMAECSDCPKGRFQTQEGADGCDECGMGKFQDEEGSKSCKGCAPGTFQGAIGNTAGCKKCPVGWFTGYDRSHYCFECFEGQYADQEGYFHCYHCPKGWSQTQKGQEECEACATGKYQDNGGRSTCLACPTGWDSAETGSVDCVLTPTTAAPEAGAEAGETS